MGKTEEGKEWRLKATISSTTVVYKNKCFNHSLLQCIYRLPALVNHTFKVNLEP